MFILVDKRGAANMAALFVGVPLPIEQGGCGRSGRLPFPVVSE